ncbi:hypothetical protein A2307_00085 [Candidatus Peregrinibacteria bacterium RIFOXYB2_FULL_33_20]|nr:MAG: hypothetical protein A2263_02100 [Candidatus Peregrinibacteria bacterium RIFOXYA2_FULL_33_21]OGJ50602.1 MAG: hypothetical protein A2307_00085 [Candidatus Peregrinibacteria bacterium RIFOXYB2_FULL_33_20]
MMLNNDYYAIRHALAKNREDRVLSSTEKTGISHPLTPEGRVQMHKVAKESGIEFDRIITSSILRTRQSAEIIQEYCGGIIMTDERLIEHQVGAFDGRSIDEWANYWKENDVRYCASIQVETWTAVRERVGALLIESNFLYKGENILFVSHELPISMLLDFINGIKRETHPRIYIPYSQFIHLNSVSP